MDRRALLGLAAGTAIGGVVSSSLTQPLPVFLRGKKNRGPFPTPSETEVPIPGTATALFQANFNGGTVASFDTGAGIQHCPPTTEVTVANTFVREGANACQFHVAGAGLCFGDSSHRAEITSGDASVLTHEGDQRWVSWSTYFPTDFTNPVDDWFIIQQWHAGVGSPPVSIGVDENGNVVLQGDGVGSPNKTLGPVRKGVWTDYVVEVKFSNTPTLGYVRGWENGILTVPTFVRQTMTSSENYFKMGIYRNPANGSTVHEVWHDNIIVYGP